MYEPPFTHPLPHVICFVQQWKDWEKEFDDHSWLLTEWAGRGSSEVWPGPGAEQTGSEAPERRPGHAEETAYQDHQVSDQMGWSNE